MLEVSVLFIPENKKTFKKSLRVVRQSTVAEALLASCVYEIYPEAKAYAVGIFSKIVSQDRILEAHDRIEIYRPLSIDPKEKRRQRAKKITGCVQSPRANFA